MIRRRPGLQHTQQARIDRVRLFAGIAANRTKSRIGWRYHAQSSSKDGRKLLCSQRNLPLYRT